MKKLYIACLFAFLCFVRVSGFAFTQEAYDSFTGTATTPLNSHTPDQGSGWTLDVCASWQLGINDALFIGEAGICFARNGTTLANDQACSFVIDGTSTSKYAGCTVRYTPNGASWSGYTGRVDDTAGHIQAIKWVTGSETSLIDSTTAWTAGDVIRIEVVGTTITLLKNGTILNTATDSSLSSGKSGMYGFQNDRYDDFRAFDQASGASALPVIFNPIIKDARPKQWRQRY